ncbi:MULTISPECIES: TrkH family potassium uptake protein [Bacillus]|uniref:TrkH family potassium uptake protein n=1 Tax=Bacillus pumilus TaxID=1408 RepID=A0AAE3WIC0_BACPU|nr:MULTISPECIES: TrkH family potassium uptake protein [Bacillus]MCY7619457.1 TrkH family potassium uptake protein [Bacillus pumilus]MDQ0816661.1 potassium uptake TrkH family protein [Bacillus pumilus]MDR4249183.1 TrkH family potassium uptake protein [Bacillus pumilus]PAC83367.1 Ktr system potassium uptake protein D [Bacillus sp. 7788]PRS40665.1 TrkH family potassium uptake protein [Bacillus sp. NMCC4]
MNPIKKLIDRLSAFQLIALYYFLAVTVSFILLSLPVAHQDGVVKWTFIDALFTAVSAVSVTGLTVVDTSQTFSVAGMWILAFVLQIGGIGIMTLGTFVWIVMRKRIGIKERKLIMADQNQSNLSGIVKLMKQVLYLILLIEFVGGLILSMYFLKYYDVQAAFLHGFFSSISATTNGGFDITGNSLIPYKDDYFVQFITMLLIIFGAIGFPVLVEVKDYLFNQDRKHASFSLFTKITTITFGSLVIVGAIGIYALEARFTFLGKSWHEVLFYSLFQSTATRSGGLSTLDITQLTEPTLLFLCLLMFIGASPSSVGGGIRTTTFALNLLALFHFARGNKSIKIFKRELHQADINKSLMVTMMAFILVFGATFLLTLSEQNTLLQNLFEVCSAFGTTGLSLGITSELSVFGKCIIMMVMFIGRIGIPSFLYLIGRRESEANYHYPKERVIIG